MHYSRKSGLILIDNTLNCAALHRSTKLLAKLQYIEKITTMRLNVDSLSILDGKAENFSVTALSAILPARKQKTHAK